MPSRIIPFVNRQFYHVYNRGNEKRAIFESRRDYQRFLKLLKYYQLEGPKPKFSNYFQYQIFKPDFDKKIATIICYCLMPNHFHLLLRQLKEGAITEFLSKLSNSYTKYFNTKYDRVGPLLQGEFKAVLVENDEQLEHLSRYIHLNPVSSFLVINPEQYEWSSYQEYLGRTYNSFCSKEHILSFFKTPQEYQQFVLDQVDYTQEIELIKHQLIDKD